MVWRSEWPATAIALPEVTDADLRAIHGEGRGSRVFTYGHGGNRRNGRIPHFISTRDGYSMHVDVGFVRFTHQVVLRNDGFLVRGLADEDWFPAQRRGTMYCLDTHSPHCIVRDRRWDDGRFKLQAAVDADEPMSPDEVVAALTPLLSVPAPHLAVL